jgi:hypothetical protein
MRIPTPDEVGFIKTWHALLMGMIDPVLDCQGIMRADDGTPMFRFGYPDERDPSIIWRNQIACHVGEHFWEKGGKLYRDTDLTSPVLDLYGEAPLTFADRAAMHDCPTLPGLGTPCPVALNLPALRQKVEQGVGTVQMALTEDARFCNQSGQPGWLQRARSRAASNRPAQPTIDQRKINAPSLAPESS